MILLALVSLTSLWVSFLGFLFCVFRRRLLKYKYLQRETEDGVSIGLFHPYCNIGNGKERVLWQIVKTCAFRYPSAQIVVYTGDTDCPPEEIRRNAKRKFDIDLPLQVEFIYLHRRKWMEGSRYPVFAVIGQTLGSIYVGLEALFKFVPDVFIDTMGYPCTLPLFKYVGNCKTGCYIHSPDLLPKSPGRLDNWGNGSNGRSIISTSNPFKGFINYMYVSFLTKIYSWMGRVGADIVMVNSTWTEENVHMLWHCPAKTYKVFPPCGVEQFSRITPLESSSNSVIKIVSISQFRAEKDHPLQIRILYQLRELLREHEWNRVRLVVIGSCRHPEEFARAKDMEDLGKHLSVEEHIEFKINISYEELQEELSTALIAIHTMMNEQFGIGVVECMAAGLITVANRSGGPMMDIIMEWDGSRSGFLATDENDYAEAIRCIMFMTKESHAVIRKQAKASVERFSDQQFRKSFLEASDSLFR